MVEEVGLEITDIKPLFFKDGIADKHLGDGASRKVYMIYLIFSCHAIGKDVSLNQEFTEYAWVNPGSVQGYDLNPESAATLAKIGLIQREEDPK